MREQRKKRLIKMNEIFLTQTPTAFIFFFATLLCFVLPVGRIRSLWLLLIPALALFQVSSLAFGNLYQIQFFGFELELMRVDKLSKVFGIITAYLFKSLLIE